MPLTVNGRPEPLPSPATLDGLVSALKLGGQRLAIEHNGEIVPRSRWPETTLAEADQIEIVRAIGGG
ncbi:MAG: sulfur carrier protein ThiS [Stagnimonas sp.]|nr:sulfur carrier protein ThiS [Stagnimonas sp.]